MPVTYNSISSVPSAINIKAEGMIICELAEIDDVVCTEEAIGDVKLEIVGQMSRVRRTRSKIW